MDPQVWCEVRHNTCLRVHHDDQASIRLPETVSARQRAWLHAAAEVAGVAHITSINADGARILTLGGTGPAVAITLRDDSDDMLRSAVLRHFPKLANEPLPAPPSLDLAVERFYLLLKQEQHAEAEEVPSLECVWFDMSHTPAQSERALQSDGARGDGLRAMRVSGMQTGLLGRTLLTLVTSKVEHALSTHTPTIPHIFASGIPCTCVAAAPPPCLYPPRRGGAASRRAQWQGGPTTPCPRGGVQGAGRRHCGCTGRPSRGRP